MPSPWYWVKDKVYYYFIHYPEPGGATGLAKVRAIRHTDHLFATLRIEKILSPGVYLGFSNRIKEGAEVSANEFQGGGANLADHYFEDEYALIRKLFEDSWTTARQLTK